MGIVILKRGHFATTHLFYVHPLNSSTEEPLERILALAGLTLEIYTFIREYPHYLIE
jgi:hypothetical protein